MTRDEIEAAFAELPRGEVRVTLFDPDGKSTATLSSAWVNRPRLLEEEPYPEYFAEYDNRPSMWIVLAGGGDWHAAWPIDEAVYDEYKRLVVSGPKGRAVYVVQP